MNRKAVSLLSGGLDSTLATKVILDQGIEVIGLHFVMPWGCCDRSAAYQAAKLFRIPVMMFRMTEDYLDVIRAPKYGYGRAMNPCVDCRIHMYGKAKVYMEEIGASFLVTGEVLGQRPKSQMRHSLKTIEVDIGLVGRIVRPLSAQHLEPTLPELEGVLDRARLLGISGRSRRMQMTLAEDHGIRNYPTPAGGCLLTDEAFSRRVKDLLDHAEEPAIEDMELLRVGRHFRWSPRTKLIVGRNEAENLLLEGYANGRRRFYHPENYLGPSLLIVGEVTSEAERAAFSLMVRYGQQGDPSLAPAFSGGGGAPRSFPKEQMLPQEVFERIRL